MLILITTLGIIKISAWEWSGALETYFQSDETEPLSLVINSASESYDLSVTSPRFLSYNCVDNSVIVQAEVLMNSLMTDQTFAPLRLEIGQYLKSGLKPVEITLLTYFYLNPLPFSTTLITQWFVDTGTDLNRASDLSNAVFYGRVNKEETDPWFIRDVKNPDTPANQVRDKHLVHIRPSGLSEVFDFINKQDEFILTYDCLDLNQQFANNMLPVVHLNKIDETGFLIEDHSVIIAGLSVSITEFSKLAEYKWPAFLKTLFMEIPLYLRDYYSVGRLLREKPGVLRSLISVSHCSIDIIGIDNNGFHISGKVENQNFISLKSAPLPAIPVFIRIIKYHY